MDPTSHSSRLRPLAFVAATMILAAGIALIPVGLGAAPSSGAGGPAGGPPGSTSRTVESHRYGYSLALPAGWRRAPRRLVPNLLDPREILSVGTFAMPVGGGGECGRDPIAAIERMRAGDSIITIQEEAETPGMRRQLREQRVPTLLSALARMRLMPELHPPGEHVSASRELWYAQVDFTERGRWFGALVWVKGTPGAGRIREVKGILASIDFRRGRFVRPLPRRRPDQISVAPD